MTSPAVYLSLCAAKLATGDTWEAAADALAWDRQKAHGCANAVTTRLNTAGHLDCDPPTRPRHGQ